MLEDQLSLAIGKAGQNVRLAARLTGWKIDINGEKIGGDEAAPTQAAEGEEEGTTVPKTSATDEAQQDAGGVSEGTLQEAENPQQQMEEKGE